MYKHTKRSIDIVFALLFAMLLCPVYTIISVLVLIFLGRPVLYCQQRIGRGGKVFNLYKFRSMTNDRDASGNLLEEEKRITKFGAILRSSSLDELPELYSILNGDMSFVGPRPLPAYYQQYFLPHELKRHEVRGGLIPPDGLSGETTPTWEKQFEYDLYYVENMSFFLDTKIIFATFGIIVKRILNNYGAECRPHLNDYRKSNK